MSRQFDAKQQVLKAYPNKCSDGLSLFLDYCNVSKSDFEYEVGMSVDKYIWGDSPSQPTNKGEIE